MFHTAESRNLMADARVSYSFHDTETAVSQSVSPHYLVSHDNRKIVSGGWKLIPATPHKPAFGNTGMWLLTCHFTCLGLGVNEGSQNI
jgi:hypothetical protein